MKRILLCAVLASLTCLPALAGPGNSGHHQWWEGVVTPFMVVKNPDTGQPRLLFYDQTWVKIDGTVVSNPNPTMFQAMRQLEQQAPGVLSVFGQLLREAKVETPRDVAEVYLTSGLGALVAAKLNQGCDQQLDLANFSKLPLVKRWLETPQTEIIISWPAMALCRPCPQDQWFEGPCGGECLYDCKIDAGSDCEIFDNTPDMRRRR